MNWGQQVKIFADKNIKGSDRSETSGTISYSVTVCTCVCNAQYTKTDQLPINKNLPALTTQLITELVKYKRSLQLSHKCSTVFYFIN